MPREVQNLFQADAIFCGNFAGFRDGGVPDSVRPGFESVFFAQRPNNSVNTYACQALAFFGTVEIIK